MPEILNDEVPIEPEVLKQVVNQVDRGDLLLFRGKGLISRAIKVIGRGEYSHAAKVDIWDGEAYCCEVREWRGGRIVTLKSQVDRFPGAIDVYQTNPGSWPGYDLEKACRVMRDFAGCDYGWRSVLESSLLYLPFIRFVRKYDYEKEGDMDLSKPPSCAQACAIADQTGGIDPVLRLSSKFVTPSDLAHSHFYLYKFTLFPP